MQYSEFIDQVQERAELSDRQDAETLTSIVLATLAEPLSREATMLVASQLPGELKELMITHRAVPHEGMQHYTLEEFHNRIKARLSVTFQQGVDAASAVTTVLAEAVTEGVMDQIKRDLPDEYRSLFKG